ncbi:MAG: AAA family ATPase, partial [Candidatus Thorarchaeota archaeon]
MKITRMELQNFKPFRKLTLPETDEELPTGLIIVRGPNSTGKSSLFEAILWALWGPAAVEPTNDELINFASSFCEVKLEFDIAGTRYEVNRSYDSAKGMSVVLSEEKKGKWKKIADKSQTVGRKMDEILNLEHQQALQTLLVRQGEVALIANATPSVLRDLLVKVYNIELLGEMTKQLESLEGDLKTQIAIKREEYRPPEHIREQMAITKERIQQDEKELKDVEKESKQAEKDLGKLPDPKDLKRASEILEKLRMKEQEHSKSIKNRDKELRLAGIVGADARIIRARLESLKKESSRLESEKDAIVQKSFGIEREIGSHEGLVKEIEEKTAILEDSDVLCPTCQKPLSNHDCERIVTEYQVQAKSHRTKIGELVRDLDTVPAEIQEIDDRLRTIPRALEAAT